MAWQVTPLRNSAAKLHRRPFSNWPQTRIYRPKQPTIRSSIYPPGTPTAPARAHAAPQRPAFQPVYHCTQSSRH